MRGRYSAHPDYQDSGLDWLGRIPKSWEARRLGSYFRERRTKVSDADFSALSVTMQGIVPQLETAAKTNDGDNRKLVRAGDFVINSRSDRKGSSGVSAYDGSVSLISIVLEPLDIHPPFAHHLLRSSAFQEEFYRFGKGIVADLWSTNYAAMKNIIIPVMPQAEQTQIAKFLDYEIAKIDALIEKQQQLIALLKEKRQAVISHAVTKGLNPDAPMRDSGLEWLGEVPAHWAVGVKLAQTSDASKGSFVNGPFGSDLLASELTDSGVPVIYIRDVKPTGYARKSTVCVSSQKAKQLDVCRVDPGNILIAKVGDPPGDACVYPESEPPAVITQDVIRIRVDRENVVPGYMAHLLNSDFGRAAADTVSVESTRKRVGLGDYKQLRFALPPVEEQHCIACFIDGRLNVLDSLIQKSETGIELLQERRTSLISAAVTGKIDVRGWKAPDSDSEAEVA